MGRFNNILELLSFSKKELIKIEEVYQISLVEKTIKLELQILIKCYIECLRSCLDYCAKDISEKILLSNGDVYFPVVESNKNIDNFRGAIGRNLPRLEITNIKIFSFLEKIQPYNKKYEWLGELVTLANNSKHENLSPQTHKRENILAVRGGTDKIISELLIHGSIVATPGAIINGKKVLDEPLIITPNNIPSRAFDYMPNISREIWESFIFDETGKEVLPSLKQFFVGTEGLINGIYKILDSIAVQE